MKELVDLENGILLEHIDANRSSTTQTLTEIIAENLCSRDDTANELEDEDAPENCEHFKIGKCKFQDPLYRPPRVFHWIGCEYPGCLKWWHESCMGVTFKSTQERERYKFVCPNHDSDDLFTDKVTVTAKDGGVLKRDNIANPPFEETHNRLLSNENYVEYDGQRAASVDDDLAIFVQPQIVAIGSFDFDKFFAVCKGVVLYSILYQSIV
ncbi:hypothetical protein ACROYT_G028388 [Oculina patagonica]